MPARLWLRLGGFAIVFGLLSCGGGSGPSSTSPSSDPPSSSSPSGMNSTICNCTPDEAASTDYRHDAKHVSLPSSSGQDITVATILSWSLGADPAFDAPRTGVENQMFHIAQAFVQFVWLMPGDCDVHMEISDTPSKTAPRMIIETPVDSEYCATRQSEVSGFARYGVSISTSGFETQQGIPVDVLGLAFRDFNHQRGTQFVATPWEIHPAIVTVK